MSRRTRGALRPHHGVGLFGPLGLGQGERSSSVPNVGAGAYPRRRADDRPSGAQRPPAAGRRPRDAAGADAWSPRSSEPGPRRGFAARDREVDPHLRDELHDQGRAPRPDPGGEIAGSHGAETGVTAPAAGPARPGARPRRRHPARRPPGPVAMRPEPVTRVAILAAAAPGPGAGVAHRARAPIV